MRARALGISLVEMLVAIVIVSVVSAAVARAYIAGIHLQTKMARNFDSRMNRIRFEDTVKGLISGTDLHGTGSYFISPVPASTVGPQLTPQDGGLGPGSASLVLTTSGMSPPAPYLSATDQQFESLNDRFGPISDCAEVSLAMLPVGQAGSLQGVFLREQRPADSDPSQGGEESVLNADIRDIRFEFYDGSSWIDSWDSRNTQKGKLPSVVQVSYLLKSESKPRIFLVRLPTSDLAVTGVTSPLGGPN